MYHKKLSYRKNRAYVRGMSLIELAIVLGVIGAVMSGLWVISGQTLQNVKQSRFSDELALISRNITGAFVGKTTFDTTDATYEMTKLTALTGIFPLDILQGGTLISPFGAQTNPIVPASIHRSMYVCGWPTIGGTGHCDFAGGIVAGNPPYTNVPLFAVEVLFPDTQSCTNAVIRNIGVSMPSGLVNLYINGIQMVLPGTGFAIPLSQVKGNCGPWGGVAGNPAVVDFIFRLSPRIF